MPEQQEARIRARYLHLLAESKQADIAADASRPEQFDEPIEAVVQQANLCTGARDLLTLAVFSFLTLLQVLAGPVSAKEDKASDKPPSGND